MPSRAEELERRIEEAVDIRVVVEDHDGRLVITGLVSSEEQHEAALDIAHELAGDNIEDNIEVTGVLPAEVGELRLSEVDTGGFEEATEGFTSDDALEPGDFTDQDTIDFPASASGADWSMQEDPAAEGDEVHVPPIDPVARRGEDGRVHIIGGLQADSMQEIEVERSALDGAYGDEAIADAVRRELLEDAATTDLAIDVHVFEGVVTLRGVVPDLIDAENAEEVAARVPGVVEVREELTVTAIEQARRV